jgi:hypothetical protein
MEAPSQESPVNGGHGTDMFKVHPELPGIIADWFLTTLIKTQCTRQRTPWHLPRSSVKSGYPAESVRSRSN